MKHRKKDRLIFVKIFFGVGLLGLAFFTTKEMTIYHLKRETENMPRYQIVEDLSFFDEKNQQKFHLSEQGDMPLAIVFFNPRCGACRKSVEALREVSKYAKILGVFTGGGPEYISNYLDDKNSLFSYIVTEDVLDKINFFKVQVTPELFLYYNGFVLKTRWSGTITPQIVKEEIIPEIRLFQNRENVLKMLTPPEKGTTQKVKVSHGISVNTLVKHMRPETEQDLNKNENDDNPL